MLALEYSKSYTVVGGNLQILRQEILPPFHSNDEETSPLTMALHTIQEGALVKVTPYKGSAGGVGVVKKKKRRL